MGKFIVLTPLFRTGLNYSPTLMRLAGPLVFPQIYPTPGAVLIAMMNTAYVSGHLCFRNVL